MEEIIEVRPGRRLNIQTHLKAHAKTTAFLIHGAGGRGDQWRKQMPCLREKFNVIVPDMLGQGKSHQPELNGTNPYTFSEFSADLKTIFQRYANDCNLILGHSYGGALAFSLAHHYQADVNKLVLVTPTPCTPHIPVPAFFNLPAPMLELCRPLFEMSVGRYVFNTQTPLDVMLEEVIASKKISAKVIKAIIEGFAEIPALDVAQCQIPTLIMLSEQDRLVSAELSRAYYKQLPQHEIVSYSHTSHALLMENPEDFNDRLLKFLAQ